MIGKPEDVVAALTDAWNRHDTDAFSSFMADDVQFVNVLGMWWKDRAETVARHKELHASIFKQSRLTGEVASVKYLRPDVALVHVTWDMVGHAAFDGSPGKPRKGVLSFVLVKDGGGWLVKAAHNTDTVPM
jgi:uncharacterized protein (TIGR02246 family)